MPVSERANKLTRDGRRKPFHAQQKKPILRLKEENWGDALQENRAGKLPKPHTFIRQTRIVPTTAQPAFNSFHRQLAGRVARIVDQFEAATAVRTAAGEEGGTYLVAQKRQAGKPKCV